MKPSGIGGQAVIEGVMMKNKSNYAVAVRKPDGDIEVSKDVFVGIGERVVFLKLPFFRGIAALIDSLVLGMRALAFSSEYYEDDNAAKHTESSKVKKNNDDLKAGSKAAKTSVREDKADPLDEEDGELVVREWKDPSETEEDTKDVKKSKTIVKEGLNKSKKDTKKSDSIAMAFTVILSFVLAIAIFVALPFVLSELLGNRITSYGWRSVIEGVIRLVLFVLYIKSISLMQDIKRVFMYHGAEHKVINCIEKGYELDVRNARRQTKEHKRCGTSFLLYVVLISIIVFVFIQVDILWLRMLLRILLVPVIAGLAYEFIRFAGKSNNIIINLLSKPGLWLQGLTTKEPDDSMLEVAIASVDAVFDWRAYQEKGRRHDYHRRRYRNRDMDIALKQSEDEDLFDDEPLEFEDKVSSKKTDKKADKSSDKKSDPVKKTDESKEKESSGEQKKEDLFTIIDTKEESDDEPETKTDDTDKADQDSKETEKEESNKEESKKEFHAVSFSKTSEMNDTTVDPLDDIDNPGDVNSFGEEETDEILKALDRYFVMDNKDDGAQ